MGHTQREPEALYGLITDSINTDYGRAMFELTACTETKLNNNSPISLENIILSFKTLEIKGRNRYHNLSSKISSVNSQHPLACP